MSVNTDGGRRYRLAKELFAPSIRSFRKRKVITRYIDELWATDLLDLRKYADENWFTGRGGVKATNKYLLVVIDSFSKYRTYFWNPWSINVERLMLPLSREYLKILNGVPSYSIRIWVGSL